MSITLKFPNEQRLCSYLNDHRFGKSVWLTENNVPNLIAAHFAHSEYDPSQLEEKLRKVINNNDRNVTQAEFEVLIKNVLSMLRGYGPVRCSPCTPQSHCVKLNLRAPDEKKTSG